ncbi:hypothetical protein [Wolbachia endosymbiont of Folsomia candida]|uniref:hypothetical protein n=1 Tax=Wolbachia endosymbiont of Folsomia candida TaxID=169402 RepID=UPI000AB62DFC|nr:hypothetical protein [Wolbachia endosymbiont of Folsomia candida]APR97920.1 hypothetical protein ASM33_01135 [Wolbachia endosymbiont of Folsomia candida]
MLTPKTQDNETGSPSVPELKKHFESPSSSVRGSVGAQTPPRSSASSNQSTPQPKPRSISLQNAGEENSPPPPIDTNPFGDPDCEEQDTSSVEGSANHKSEEHLYAAIDPRTKSSKKSSGSDSGVDDPSSGMKRSASVGTLYSEPWDRAQAVEDLNKRFEEVSRNSSDTPSTGLPSYSDDTNSEADSNTPLIKSDKITNRFWPRAKYSMQQKSFIIPTVGATFITLYLAAYTTLSYMQNKSMFIAFITNNPKFITVPGIIAASLFAIGIICVIKQANNTIEHEIQEKNPDKVLKKVLELQPKDKIIKSVRLEYSNNTHSNFTFNTWKSQKGFVNIDEKIVNRTSKIESVFNDRPVFTALLTGFVVANVALPLGLYAAGGISNVTTFYQSLLATNIGLSLLVASSVLALSILCLGVHYYNKTNCTNRVYPHDDPKGENVNPKLIDKIKEERTNVLGENHSQDGKCSSLLTERVVVKAHNCSTLLIECC